MATKNGLFILVLCIAPFLMTPHHLCTLRDLFTEQCYHFWRIKMRSGVANLIYWSWITSVQLLFGHYRIPLSIYVIPATAWVYFPMNTSSVVRQKGESQNGGNKKQTTRNFPKNKHFLPPDTHISYQRVRNVRFSKNSACFAFLLPPFWDLPFCLITDE